MFDFHQLQVYKIGKRLGENLCGPFWSPPVTRSTTPTLQVERILVDCAMAMEGR